MIKSRLDRMNYISRNYANNVPQTIPMTLKDFSYYYIYEAALKIPGKFREMAPLGIFSVEASIEGSYTYFQLYHPVIRVCLNRKYLFSKK